MTVPLIRFAGLALTFCALNICAQVNSWTNSTSGNWQESEWSLGALPGTNQTILLTNSGWKALAIGPSTVSEFPETLTVDSIRISSPTDSFNTLLLNHSGLAHPLHSRSLVLSSNSAVTLVHSALRVDSSGTSAFSANGVLTAIDGSLIEAPFMSLGESGSSVLNLTNSQLFADVEFFGGAFPGTVYQASGTNAFTTLHLNNADYFFNSGVCVGDIVIGDNFPAAFHQSGGMLSGKVEIAQGSFELAGGNYSADELIIPARAYSTTGSFLQTGGTNDVSALTVGVVDFGGSGGYALSNGVLNTEETLVSYYGTIEQSGGEHLVAGSLNLHGGLVMRGGGEADAFYYLNGGNLRSESIDIVIGDFSQSGGTNQTGDLTMGPHYATCKYELSGGRLETANVIVGSTWRGGFHQTGGIHAIDGRLSITGDNLYSPEYVIEDGELLVRDIQISRGDFRHLGGRLTQSGIVSLASGTLEEQAETQNLGALQLGVFIESESKIDLSGSATVLHFAASSSLTWSNDAVLWIQHWNGSVTGGGADQLFFGKDTDGLTPQQLNQIRFCDPAGAPPGFYPARILTNGEIVPGPFLNCTRTADRLVIRWNSSCILQTATDPAGPFEDLTNACSPFTNNFADAQRFFRLKQ